MRVGFLGPEGTFSDEALHADPRSEGMEAHSCVSVHEAVMGVESGALDRALVPIENSLEGSIGVTLDTLAVEATGVEIVGETVLPVRHCLIAARERPLVEIERVLSHPQPLGQCARFLREQVGDARVVAVASTAEAVRTVAGADEPWAAIGTRRAAGLYGAAVLVEGIEDVEGNATRFVWLAPSGAGPFPGTDAVGRWKTSLVFWGAGDNAPGWLVRCLSELAFRGVNLTLIESRPRRRGLGHYMFFADAEGRADDPALAGAIEAIGAQAEAVRVLGSYPSAAR